MGETASYSYYSDGLRASKTVNRERTDFVWDGQNLAAENKADTTNTYIYDPTGVHSANQNGTVVSYLKDYHGNIVGKTTESGALFNELDMKMDYDAFGNQWIGDTPDPFGYCGEYYDTESGLIYLRNRYYDSSIGRFISEDPAKDGTNWYVYCGNNPVMMVDPSGLFGRNTQLYYNPTRYNEDIRKLQNELAWNGYLEKSDVNGYFDLATWDAVNCYKNDNGLTNTGEYQGVVGITTWEHLGLKADSNFEFGGVFDTPGVKGRGAFLTANGPSIKNGVLLGDVNIGMMKYSGDYNYWKWEIEVASGNAALGFTKDFVGAELGANLISAEGGFKFKIPFTDNSLYVGGEGNLIGIGVKGYLKDGKLTLGVTALVGVGITLGID